MAGLSLGSLKEPEMPSHVILVGLAGFAADGPWMACVGLSRLSTARPWACAFSLTYNWWTQCLLYNL